MRAGKELSLIHIFFINQLREKIGVMFGNPETTTGGNALKFYASVRLDIRKATAVSYTHLWKKPGVWNVEEFDPDPFMEQVNKQGLPWHEVFAVSYTHLIH